MREGDSSGTVSDFGALDLETVRKALATYVVPARRRWPHFGPAGEPNPFQHEFAVQLEVSRPGDPDDGHRPPRALDLHRPDALAGLPEAARAPAANRRSATRPRGRGTQELIVPTEDGTVHAYMPDGSELKGWPVQTGSQASGLGHGGSPGARGARVPREPPRGPMIADLAGKGEQRI